MESLILTLFFGTWFCTFFHVCVGTASCSLSMTKYWEPLQMFIFIGAYSFLRVLEDQDFRNNLQDKVEC